MRHPALRVFQLLCAAAVTAAAASARPLPASPEKPLWVSVLGETERDDGSWTGADLLGAPGARIDRFQVTLRPERAVRVRLEVVTAGGAQQLYPAHAGDATLSAGQAWALPGPRSFFELRGEARLRLVVSLPNTDPGAPIPARFSQATHPVWYPLSDGSSFEVTERSLVAPAGRQTVLELALPGR